MAASFEVNVVILCFVQYFRSSRLQFNIHNVPSFIVALCVEKRREIYA